MAQESLMEGILRSLRRHQGMAVVIIGLAVLSTSLLNRFQPPEYETEALLRILASDEKAGTSLAESMNGILSQRPVMAETLKSCGFDASYKPSPTLFALADAGPGLVRLTVRHSDPTALKDLGDSLIRTLSERFLAYASELQSFEIEALERRKAALQEKFREVKREIANSRLPSEAPAAPSRGGAPSMAPAGDSPPYGDPSDLGPASDEARTLEAEIAAGRDKLRNLPRIHVIASKELTRSFSDTSNALSEARGRLFELLKTYREKHPKVVNLLTVIEKLESKLKQVSRNRDREQPNPAYERLENLVLTQEARLAELRRAVPADPAGEILARNREDPDSLQARRRTYESLLNETAARIEDLRLKETTSLGRIQVLQKDRDQPRPYGLSHWQRQVIGLMSGFLMAVFLLYSPTPLKAEVVGVSPEILFGSGPSLYPQLEYVQNILQVPALSQTRLALPQPDPVQMTTFDDRLVVLNDPTSPLLDPFRTLCSNLQVILSETSTRIIHVCSSRTGMGRTTLVSNLAILFAQAGYSTVLVDANFRKPALHRVFDLDNHQGLSTILCGKGDFKLVQPTTIKNLGVLTSGPLPPSSAELLGSVAMIELLDTLKRRVELVLIDTPALLDYPDAGILASHAGGIVFLHREGEPETDICASKDFLTNIRAKVLGFVKT